MFKKIISYILLALSIAFLCGCSTVNAQTADFKKDKKRIAFVSPQTEEPVWLQAKVGFLQAAKDFDFYGIWLGGGNCDVEDMVREIDIAIAQKVDAVITCPLTPSRFSNVFDKLKEHNIPLVTVAVDAVSEDERSAYVGSDYKSMGKVQAQALHEQVGDEMKIGVIMSGITTQNQVIQVEMLQELLRDLPNSYIIEYAEDWADPVIGMNVFTKMLDKHPDMNACFVTSGGAISVYGKIISQRNLEDKLTLIGMDIIKENLDVVKNGSIYGVMSQDFYNMGYIGGKYALQAANGQEVPSVTYTYSQLITKDNIGSAKVIDTKDVQ